ncbi:MAG: TolC family protein [Bacteroidota bacterium]
MNRLQQLGLVLLVSIIVGGIMEAQQDTLTLARCIQTALENHPAVRVAEGALLNSEAALQQTRSIFFPQLSASGGMTKNAGTSLIGPIQRVQDYESYSAGLSAQMLLFDFGKSIYRTMASSYGVDTSVAAVGGTKQTVILNAELAYFAYQETSSLVKVSEDALRSSTQHLQQAKAFFSVGTRAQFDVTKAEVDVANAQVALLRAQNQFRIARAQLDNAMGIQTSKIYVTPENMDLPSITMTVDSALVIAKVSRPEILSSASKVSVSEALYTASWMTRFPTISATGGYIWRGLTFPLSSSWSAGVTISVPLFQGFAVDAGVQQAEAGIQIASATYEALVRSARLEIEQQILSLNEARERIAASAKLVEQATENLRLADARYASGVGSAIEITDALATLSNARIIEIQAQFDYRSAYVQLQRAMGILTPIGQQ